MKTLDASLFSPNSCPEAPSGHFFWQGTLACRDRVLLAMERRPAGPLIGIKATRPAT
jgi:hypothetical protein